jgi:hypothetical protein
MAWSLDGIAAWQRGCWTASRCGDVATYVVSRKLHRLKRSRRGRLDGVAAWRPMWFPHGCRGWTASRRGRLGGVTAWRRGSGTASRRGVGHPLPWRGRSLGRQNMCLQGGGGILARRGAAPGMHWNTLSPPCSGG